MRTSPRKEQKWERIGLKGEEEEGRTTGRDMKRGRGEGGGGREQGGRERLVFVKSGGGK